MLESITSLLNGENNPLVSTLYGFTYYMYKARSVTLAYISDRTFFSRNIPGSLIMIPLITLLNKLESFGLGEEPLQ